MAAPLAPKLALARAVGRLSRLGGAGATSAPGKVLLRLEPNAIAALAGRLREGSVVISATNGKTTTAAMVAQILGQANVSVVHNQAGANMAGGIASTLLEALGPRGVLRGDLGLFEVDEAWLPSLVAQLHPRAVLLGNLFRDQLDRYGELETIAERWDRALRTKVGPRTRLILNADDPLIADLGYRSRGDHGGQLGVGADDVRADGVLYFGIQDDSLALAGMDHAADAKHCRRCGSPYVFDAVYLGHLGHYHCPTCGNRRPSPQVSAESVTLEGVRRARFTLCVPTGRAEVTLDLPGLYNVYNALAAAAVTTALGVALQTVVAGLESTRAAFGRAETVMISNRPHGGARELRILLIKNPAGTNEVLRTLTLEPGEHDLLCILNDHIADGQDISWIWDADFERLAGRARRVTCAGTRAAELALRMKYAGIETDRIEVLPDLALALATAAMQRAGEAQSPLFALPTYTAMLALRELLVSRGEAESAWG